MPYASAKQANLMRAVAHSPSFAKKVGISQSVGQKFEAHKAKGGTVKESKEMMGKEVAFMKKKGAPKSMVKHEMAEMKYAKGGSIDGIAKKGKTKGKMVTMKRGGKC
jgi:pantoate kinase